MPDNDIARSLIDVLRLFASAAGSAGSPPASTSTGSAPGASREGRLENDRLELLGQLFLVWMASGVRYWSRAAEIWARALPPLARALAEPRGPEQAGEAQRVLIDELRSCLRALAELPIDEARRVQAELEALVRGSNAQDASPSDAHWQRRWKAKD